jgi:hypothetical protein
MQHPDDNAIFFRQYIAPHDIEWRGMFFPMGSMWTCLAGAAVPEGFVDVSIENLREIKARLQATVQ